MGEIEEISDVEIEEEPNVAARPSLPRCGDDPDDATVQASDDELAAFMACARSGSSQA